MSYAQRFSLHTIYVHTCSQSPTCFFFFSSTFFFSFSGCLFWVRLYESACVRENVYMLQISPPYRERMSPRVPSSHARNRTGGSESHHSPGLALTFDRGGVSKVITLDHTGPSTCSCTMSVLEITRIFGSTDQYCFPPLLRASTRKEWHSLPAKRERLIPSGSGEWAKMAKDEAGNRNYLEANSQKYFQILLENARAMICNGCISWAHSA